MKHGQMIVASRRRCRPRSAAQSQFRISILSVPQIVALAARPYGGGYSPQVVGEASECGQNLCATGSVLSVGLQGNPAPSWDVAIDFPTDPSIPYTSYRVLGLSETYNAWVEMPTTQATGFPVPAVTAQALTYHPAGIIPGTVAGPYMLTYYSTSPCPSY